MRTTRRTLILILLIGIWPQFGCLQLPVDKSVQDLRPIQQKTGAAPPQELTAADIGQSLITQAKALEDARNTAEAVAMYEKIRATDATQAVYATKKLALIYLRHNELDRAEQEYKLLWAHNPKDADTLCSLGDISYRRGLFGMAEKLLKDALSRQPDHPHALANLAMTLAQLGKDEESLEMYKKVPGTSEGDAYCRVAFVMTMQKRPEDAIRYYQSALVREPGNQGARSEIARMYQADPNLAFRMTTVRMTTPSKMEPATMETRGVVDVEPASLVSSEGMGRLMIQRPTLPPSPDFDLAESNGRAWQTSGKKK